ncbi:MAG: multidrug effflux MFS transporter [Acidimicrobiia bacterium]
MATTERVGEIPPGQSPAPLAKAPLKLVLILGALMCLGPLSIDTYLPSLPTIEEDFAASASTVQLTLTGMLIGLGAGQLVIGPLADVFGRRRPLIAGTVLHIGASVGCLLAPSVGVLSAFRLVQGLGASATTVITLAIVRDLYTGRTAALLLSLLLLVIGATPLIAPSLGGLILRLTSWRGVFGVLALLGVAFVVLAVVALPETLPAERRRPGSLSAVTAAYRSVLRDRTFDLVAVSTGFTHGALFAFVAGSSFVLQDQFGVSEQAFGLLFTAIALCMIAGTQLAAHLLQRESPEHILMRALFCGVAASALLVGLAVAGTGGILGFMIPAGMVMHFGGHAMPNGPAVALSLHGEAAGTAAALIGGFRYLIAAGAAPVVGALGNDHRATAIVMCVAMVLSTLTMVAARPGLARTQHRLAGTVA